MKTEISLSRQKGTSLLEGLIAVAIFSIGILGLASMQLNAMQSSQQSKYRAMASFYAEEMTALILTDQANITKYTDTCSTYSVCNNWLTRLQADLPNSTSNDDKPVITYTASTGVLSTVIHWKHPGALDKGTYTLVTNLKTLGAI